MSRILVAGVDAGATRTRSIIADEQGIVLGRSISGPGNPTALGWDKALENIYTAIYDAMRQAGTTSVCSIAISAPYTGWGKYRHRYTRFLLSKNIASKVIVYEDYRAALLSCFPEGNGIVYIMGTGSSCYGRYNEKEALAGGWGHLLGDEGSAYHIGRDGIIAVLKYYDGRGGYTKLYDYIFEWSRKESIEEIVSSIYNSESPKTVIASFAPYVIKACREGDEVAYRIVENAVNEALKTIQAIARKLSINKCRACIVGGLYEKARDVIEPLLHELVKKLNETSIEFINKVAPVECAMALEALKTCNDGKHIDYRIFLKNCSETLKSLS